MAMIRVDLQLETDARAPVTGAARTLRLMLEVVRDPLFLVILLLVAGGAVYMVRETRTLTAERDRLAADVTRQQQDSVRYAGDLADAQKLKAKQAASEQSAGRIKAVDDNRFAFTHLMDEAARQLPADSWLQSVVTVRDDAGTRNAQVRITGYAPNESAVTDYLTRLNDTPWLANGQLSKSARVQVNRQTLISFELLVDTEIPDPAFYQVAGGAGREVLPPLPGATSVGAPGFVPGPVPPAVNLGPTAPGTGLPVGATPALPPLPGATGARP